MRIVYNDNDKGAAAWLSELGRTGAIPRGRVITTSITELEPGNVAQADQVHFFAGIGGWAHALELAGYADLRCWTGSPPCQPFSVAGQQRGKDDARHLAPAWLYLVEKCRPPILFGEQVADAIRHGWLDDLFNALEECGYACGAAVLPACSVGAPHIRKRLFFGAVRVADSVPAGRPEWRSQSGERQAPRRSGISGMANSDRIQRGRLSDGEGCQPDRTQAGWDESDRFSEPDMSVERVAFSACEQHNRSRGVGARWGLNIQTAVQLAGWHTPLARDGDKLDALPSAIEKRMRDGREIGTAMEARMTSPSGWTEHMGPIRITASGQVLTGSDAGTASSGQLSPAHSRWLMGYPPEWDVCGVTAMPSCRKSQRPL